MLGWFGYQIPPDDVTQFSQPASALLAIRLMVSFVGAVILVGTIVLAWSYPLSREKYARIEKLLRKEEHADPWRRIKHLIFPGVGTDQFCFLFYICQIACFHE